VQIYVTRRGRVVVRVPPHGPPTPGQEESRQRFAQAAHKARGRQKQGALPPAAQQVKLETSGKPTGLARSREPAWVMLLRRWLLRNGYSPSEAEVCLEIFKR
jgi:hypothetical protein